MQHDGCTISRCSLRDGRDIVHVDDQGQYNEYVGRKSLPQMIVLVVCDWNMNLVHIDSNFTGRTQDNSK